MRGIPILLTLSLIMPLNFVHAKSANDPVLPRGKEGYVLYLRNFPEDRIVLPGDHIDVQAHYPSAGKDDYISAVVLRHVMVIAVGRPASRAKGYTKSGEVYLTLALDHKEIKAITRAEEKSAGDISITVLTGEHPDPGPPIR